MEDLRMAEHTKFQIGILGAGPGGYVAAIRAAQLGASVALVEQDALGGTCLNRGCIPSKALISTAELLDEIRHANQYGIEVGRPTLNLGQAMARKDKIVNQLVKGVGFLMKKGHVAVFSGRGRLLAPHRLGVALQDGQRELECETIILATGSEPLVIPIPGHDLPGVITSDQAVHLTELPASMAVIGGGPIGVELAYVYSRFGSRVTLIEMLDHLVPAEDDDISDTLERSLKKGGIKVRTGAKVQAIEQAQTGLVVKYAAPDGQGQVEAERVLMAVGRRACTKNLGLEEVGVELDRSNVKVDDHRRTSIESIFAIGDCTRGAGLAHTASHEGIAAFETALGHEGHVNYDAIPACTFTVPEIGSVGLTERACQERGVKYTVGRFDFRASGKALAMNAREGFAKVIAEQSTGKVLGAHIIGPGATDLVAEMALAIQLGATAEQIAETVHAHPTLPEVLHEAALDSIHRALHK